MVDRVRDAFFALDSDWRFRYLNDGAETLLERSRAELIGRVMWDEFPETVETQFADGFYRAMDEQVPVSFEVYHTPLETWFEARAFPAPDGLSVYMRDVTQRKARETELAQHAAAVEAMHDGVVTLDAANRIVSLNRAMEDILGVVRESLIGEHVDAVTDLASVDNEDARSLGRAIDAVSSGNSSYRSVELTIEDAADVERVTEVRMVPVEDGDAVIAAIVRDVTEQREHERIVHSLHEITRLLLESTDPEEICAIAVHAGSELLDLPISGIWLLDDEYGYLDPVAGTAGAYEEFGGLPRFHPGDGLVWEVFEAGETARFDDLEAAEDLYNEDTTVRSEVIAPIGTYGVLMTGSLSPHRFDETDQTLISTLAENTRSALDRADRERVLRDRTERLERQTERLEAVANVLSEDLKRELSTVAQALEDDQSTPEEWEFPLADDRVEQTLERTERLVDDVREYARNATAVGPRTRIDLAVAVEDAIESSRLTSASVVVDAEATLRADFERFRYLLQTVFDEADARSAGDVTVQVGTVGLDGPTEGSRGFFILDDASEIPPAAHERAFDIVSDPDATTDGLGLAVARAIAEAHDWSVSITNGENGGTRFEVRDVTTLDRI